MVDFHHARGPEIEHWIGAPPSRDPAEDNDWGLIPYMALPDGAHSLTEEFSYFTLVHKGKSAAKGAKEEWMCSCRWYCSGIMYVCIL